MAHEDREVLTASEGRGLEALDLFDGHPCLTAAPENEKRPGVGGWGRDGAQ